MKLGLTTVVIPCYNHAATLGAAIDGALAQTAPVEVVVIDDGSTDDSAEAIARYGSRVRGCTQDHAGPSVARNRGIDMAAGEFVMFLDADDVIAPTKVTEQLAEFARHPEAGWVLCDVRIEDAAANVVQNASQRYGYASKELGGWIRPQLIAANFIPIMAPLVRRSVLGSHIRFNDDLVPEDWHFWCDVAGAARVRYVPKVLATYRKSRTGRSRIPKPARSVMRNIEQPLRLNLGCGVQGTRSWHPMKGMVNLDRSLGWRFEDGLADFVTGSVTGITVSHALMYVALPDWPAVFREFARVLAPSGVLRITEDDTATPGSRTYGTGWQGSEPAVTLTDAAMVAEHIRMAGMKPMQMPAGRSAFRDRSLCQAQHGEVPDVFFVEGVRESCVLFSPHADDECLFAAFTILRYRPRVVICFPSAGDYGSTEDRLAESREVVDLLGGGPVEQWDGRNLLAKMTEIEASIRPTMVFAPSRETSHDDHLATGAAAGAVFGDRVVRYHTYDANGKVRGRPVEFEPGWTAHKLRALSRYKSQIEHPRANAFFMQDLAEYTE